MAKKTVTYDKEGLTFYTVDVDMLKDIKVRKILKECGIGTIDVLVSMLGYIYGFKGYYIVFDADLAFIIADEIINSEEFVIRVINKSLEVDFFNKLLFEKYKILTSKRIQNNYIRVVKSSRVKRPEIQKKYLLVFETSEENNKNAEEMNKTSEENNKNAEDLRKNLDNSTVKNSTVKDNKIKDSKNVCESYKIFYENYPRKVSRSKGLEIWSKKMTEQERTDCMAKISAIQEYYKTTPEKYIPHISTFLNGKRWEDDLKPEHQQLQTSNRVTEISEERPSTKTIYDGGEYESGKVCLSLEELNEVLAEKRKSESQGGKNGNV